MNFLRRLLQKSSQVSNPETLRDQLFSAVNAKDASTLFSLAKSNRLLISEHFHTWTNIRSYSNIDPKNTQQLQYVMNGLGGIAQLFRDQFKDASLWNQLVGDPKKNPLLRAEQILKDAADFAAKFQYSDAINALSNLLIETKSLAGNAAYDFRAKSHGLIGTCLFHDRRVTDALAHFHRALDLCITLNDREGIRIYLQNLFEAHRYLGESEQAAEFAERLSQFHGTTVDATSWKKRADLVRSGEPLLRMKVQMDNASFELNDAPSLRGKSNCFFERNRITLAPSQALTIQADKFAVEAQFDRAIELYRDAMKADPFNPQPHYNAALAFAFLERHAEAIEEYETAHLLAPHWFNVGSSLYLAQEVLAGRLPHKIFAALAICDNFPLPPLEKLKMLDQSLTELPTLAHLHFTRAITLLTLNRRDEAASALDSALSFDPEPDVRSRILAQQATLTEPAKQKELFQKILLLPNPNLMSQAMAHLVLNHLAK